MRKRHDKKIFSIRFILILLLVLGGIFYSKFIYLDWNDKYALKNFQDLHDMMQDDDSFKLEDDILTIVCNDIELLSDEEANPHTFTYIKYSSINDLGVREKVVAIYEGHTYIGDFDEDSQSETLEKIKLAQFVFDGYLNNHKYGEVTNKYKVAWRVK